MATAPKSASAETPLSGYDWPAIIKDLIGTAVITFLILTPIVSFRTILDQGNLSLTTRWPLALGLTLLVMAGRLLLHLFLWKREGAPAAPSILPNFVSGFSSIGKYVAPALLVIAILLPLVSGGDKRTIDLAIYILTYVMLGWGLNIVVGLAGLLDLGYVAFYAVGAYAYALLSTVYLPIWFGDGIVPWVFYITLPLAGLLAASWGVILGFPVLRLRGDYLAIVTLAFGEIIRLVLVNWFAFTNGPQGITVPKPSFFGLPFKDEPGGFADFFGLEFDRIHFYIFLYYVILVLALLTYAVTNRLRRLPIGRAWEALREDEIACRALGINTTNTKLTAFAIGAMFGGFAGCFFAARQGFISPESFVYLESAIILAIVVLGGLGSQIGIVFSTIAIMGAFELFRELNFLRVILPQGTDPIQFRMLAVGLAMVLMMRFRPRGFVTRRDPTVFLKEKKSISSDLVAEGHG
ncbi:MAG: high-affinity branched-chain amino acid ABC transporter permease LivM [Aestuariivirga sp.]